VVALACKATAPGPVDAPLAQVASVQLIDAATGNNVTSHLALYPPYSSQVYVHLFEAGGQQIAALTDAPVAFGVTFSPSSLATAITDSVLLSVVVTPTAASNTPGTWSIHLHSAASMTDKVFGPFNVLIH